MIEAKKVIDSLTEEGKIITINIKILNSGLAAKLADTMHGHNLEHFGVEVHSWGFWDILTARKLRNEAIEKEELRHAEAIQSINSISDSDILKG